MTTLLIYFQDHISNGFKCALGTVLVGCSIRVTFSIIDKKFKDDVYVDLPLKIFCLTPLVALLTLPSSVLSMIIDPQTPNKYVVYYLCGLFLNGSICDTVYNFFSY